MWIVNSFLYFRWVLFYSWIASIKTVKKRGKSIRNTHKITLKKQFFDVYRTAAAHSIPPSAYYRFKLYERVEDSIIFEYIYNQEIQAFHYLRDQQVKGNSIPPRKLLSDKYQFSQFLSKLEIPVVQSQLILRGADISALYSAIECIPTAAEVAIGYFLKPRQANQARGAFSLSCVCNNFIVRTISGDTLKDRRAREYVYALIQNEDYLAQPNYINHPDLHVLEDGVDVAISIRIITQHYGSKIGIYCCFADIPIRHKNQLGFLPIEIQEASGLINSNFLESTFYDEQIKTRIKEINSHSVTIPFWEKCLEAVIHAHRHFPPLFSVAWDLIVTPHGPVVLEGNTNWRIDVPQQLRGGLLKESILK